MHWQGFGWSHLCWHAWGRGRGVELTWGASRLPAHSPGGEGSLTEASSDNPREGALSLPTREHKRAALRPMHTPPPSFFFSSPGLEMGRWAEKVCHQQKRTKWEDMTDRLEGKIDRLHISQPGSLSSFLGSSQPHPPPISLLNWPWWLNKTQRGPDLQPCSAGFRPEQINRRARVRTPKPHTPFINPPKLSLDDYLFQAPQNQGEGDERGKTVNETFEGSVVLYFSYSSSLSPRKAAERQECCWVITSQCAALLHYVLQLQSTETFVI